MSGTYLLFIILYLVCIIITVFIVKKWTQNTRKKTIERLEKEYDEKSRSLVASQEILISQIQPHFIYNVLNTIKYLCKHNPNEASVAIDKFSAFLRESMDTLSSSQCIPFNQEMEIIENYIYLEKRRFGDKVEVKYEINVTDFLIPALSAQTMVENAIKHGITKNIGGGKVWIKTYENEDNYMVEITDNGVGFYVDSVDKEDGKTHIGIKNTKNRIESMCKGTLKIESEVGSMTRVLMTIPKEGNDG